jgi:hypothetical protein
VPKLIAEELPDGAPREPVETGDQGWRLVWGEPSAGELEQLRLGHRAPRQQDDERRSDDVALGGHEPCDPSVGDRGMGHELALHIAGIDRPTAGDEPCVDTIDDPDVAPLGCP